MRQYHELLRHILDTGIRHEDRTGVGTISAFGYQTRFDLREGFPIVTTKRVPFRWVAEELFWFLSGDTNEKGLSARGVDIWAEWATAEQTGRLCNLTATINFEQIMMKFAAYAWFTVQALTPILNSFFQL